MFRKFVSCGLVCSMLLVPCVAFAGSHHHSSRPYRHHERYRPHYRHHHHRSMHHGDYAAIVAGVIIGAILAR